VECNRLGYAAQKYAINAVPPVRTKNDHVSAPRTCFIQYTRSGIANGNA
jgi:hypothetical protein